MTGRIGRADRGGRRGDARGDAASIPARVATVVLDGADPQSVRDGIAEVVARFGRIDILVNNAGSAGPKQPIEQLPLDARRTRRAAEAAARPIPRRSATRSATCSASPGTSPAPPRRRWARAGRSSTSRRSSRARLYYARAAYVVPKAAMNAWSRELSLELGPARHPRQPGVPRPDRERAHPHRSSRRWTRCAATSPAPPPISSST